jgi:hypothetical protein
MANIIDTNFDVWPDGWTPDVTPVTGIIEQVAGGVKGGNFLRFTQAVKARASKAFTSSTGDTDVRFWFRFNAPAACTYVDLFFLHNDQSGPRPKIGITRETVAHPWVLQWGTVADNTRSRKLELLPGQWYELRMIVTGWGTAAGEVRLLINGMPVMFSDGAIQNIYFKTCDLSAVTNHVIYLGGSATGGNATLDVDAFTLAEGELTDLAFPRYSAAMLDGSDTARIGIKTAVPCSVECQYGAEFESLAVPGYVSADGLYREFVMSVVPRDYQYRFVLTNSENPLDTFTTNTKTFSVKADAETKVVFVSDQQNDNNRSMAFIDMIGETGVDLLVNGGDMFEGPEPVKVEGVAVVDTGFIDPMDSKRNCLERALMIHQEILDRAPIAISGGNHDKDVLINGPYSEVMSVILSGLPFPDKKPYWSFDQGYAHYSVLDSASTNGTVTQECLDWLQADLEGTEKPWKIILVHHAAYGWPINDTHGQVNQLQGIDNRAELWPILKRYGVQLIVCGHQHYYSGVMMDGIYTLTLSRTTQSVDGDLRPAMKNWSEEIDGVVHYPSYGSLAIGKRKAGHVKMIVKAKSLDISFIESTTKKVLHSHRLIQPPGATVARQAR